MVVLVASYVVTPPITPRPVIHVRFRLLREGEVTAGAKYLRFYRGWDSVQQVCMAFFAEAGFGEFTQTYTLDLATVLAQGDWLAAGVDDEAPRKTRASYVTFTDSGVLTFNITSGEGGGGGVDGYTLRSGDRLLVIDAAGTVVGLTPTP